MNPGRFNFLMSYENAQLTKEEVAEGWHFCFDWDGLLIHKDDPEAGACTCFPPTVSAISGETDG